MRKETMALRKAPKVFGSLLNTSAALSGINPVSQLVKVLTTVPKATPMITATARSTRFPRRMKFLKPVIGVLLSETRAVRVPIRARGGYRFQTGMRIAVAALAATSFAEPSGTAATTRRPGVPLAIAPSGDRGIATTAARGRSRRGDPTVTGGC